MKSYEIWLKGGGSMIGLIKEADAHRLSALMESNKFKTFTFMDGDGDSVFICIEEMAAFVFRDEKQDEGIGFAKG